MRSESSTTKDEVLRISLRSLCGSSVTRVLHFSFLGLSVNSLRMSIVKPHGFYIDRPEKIIKD